MSCFDTPFSVLSHSEGLSISGSESSPSGLPNSGDAALEESKYVNSKVTDQLSQVPSLLRGSLILDSRKSLTDLASYDHAWRILQERYAEVGALIGQRETFSCAHDITNAFVDAAAKQCFLSAPYGCGKSVITVAASFLLLLCGKIQTVVVCCNNLAKSSAMLHMMRTTCDAAKAYIAAADLPPTVKSAIFLNIQQLSNVHANAIFRFVSTSEAEVLPNISDALVVWDAPIPVSSTAALKLKQYDCVLVVSNMPLSFAQAFNDSDLLPISKHFLELKMECLSQEIHALMNRIKRLQAQQYKTIVSRNSLDDSHASAAQETEIASLHHQMREKVDHMESLTLNAICHRRAFYFVPTNGFRSLVSYCNRGTVKPSWAICVENPSAMHATRRILLQSLNLSCNICIYRIALFLFRYESSFDVMKTLCASVGVQCILHPALPECCSSSPLVVLCILFGSHLPRVELPKAQVVFFFAEPCLDSEFDYQQEVMTTLQKQFCGFDHEFGRSEYPILHVPHPFIKYLFDCEVTMYSMSPQSYRSYFHPICGSVSIKAESKEAPAFIYAFPSASSDRRNFLCRRLLMLLLQNPNLMSYHCGDRTATVDKVQHKEIRSRLELCMAVMHDPSCSVGVATEGPESVDTLRQMFKAAQENRHYPSKQTFHIAWRCNIQPKGNILLLFALVGWTFDVSCETAVFVANSPVEDLPSSSSNHFQSNLEAGFVSSASVKISDSLPPRPASAATNCWATYQKSAELRRFAAKKSSLEHEAFILVRDMASIIDELCQRLINEDFFSHDKVCRAAHTTVSKAISRDPATFLLSIQAAKGSDQRESLIQSLRTQTQLLILSSFPTISVQCKNDDAVTLLRRMGELASPTKFSKMIGFLEDSAKLSDAAQIENVFAVDRIVGQKMVDGCSKFRVRWEGFSPQEDTWEPADNISDVVLQDWESKKRKAGTAEHFIVDQTKRSGSSKYRLRWQGFGPKEDTWEPEETILGVAMKEWKQKVDLMKMSKARASGTSLPNSSREASDPTSMVGAPSSSSNEVISKRRPLPDYSEDFSMGSNRTSSRRKHSVLSTVDGAEFEPKRKRRDIRVGKAPDIFYVDRIVEQTIINGIIMYKVRWMGYSASEDTWEPVSNISARVLAEWSQFLRSS